MSATEQMRQMLDQLMGTAREGESKRSRYDFTDERVCRSFLLDCCPHDIFASTRMDLGECKKVHDLALRADYEKASKTKDYGFEIDAYKTLQDFVQNSDRKIELSKKRLAESKEELNNEKFNRDHELAEQIGKKLAEAEKEGAEGNVEQSLKLMEEVEQLKKQKEIAENEYKNSVPSSNFQKQKLRVCEVCSAYLDIYDNDRRLADHFGGKLHLGYITVREKYESLKEIVNNRRKERLRERRDISRSPPDRNREKRRRDDRYENDRDSRRYNHREGNDRRYNRDRSRSRERRSPRSNDRYDRNSSASYSSRNSREKR